MYRIWKMFSFAAAHQLDGLPPEHQCSRLHGHNYVVELELEAVNLDETGFVVDYGELKTFQAYLDNTWDHRFLNECEPFMAHGGKLSVNPTAENMARHLFNLAQGMFSNNVVSAVRVQETPRTWAEYRP